MLMLFMLIGGAFVYRVQRNRTNVDWTDKSQGNENNVKNHKIQQRKRKVDSKKKIK